MTKKQVEKLAELVGQVGVAAIIGGAGDLAINGHRVSVDLLGIAGGLALTLFSVYLTGLLDGDSL